MSVIVFGLIFADSIVVYPLADWLRENRGPLPGSSAEGYAISCILQVASLFFVLAFCAWAIGIALVWRDDRVARRIKRGQCAACGYSLRGTPDTVTCPECGATTIKQKAETQKAEME
jgi:hypothetical protein